jgi:aminoglycoside phosphotransferase (APT) family kinase protein
MTGPPEIIMPERPKSDRPIDDAIALAALREQFPEKGFRQALPLGSGWATEAYLVDECLVARFPRNAELAEWLDRDEALLRYVADCLGAAVAVPEVRYRGRPGRHLPHGFLVCALVPGIGADNMEAPANDLLPEELGVALTHIHSAPLDGAKELGLGQEAWDDYEGPLRFIHGDFSPDNIMVDRVSGRLAGVIDWGNAAIGDPALDFVPLVLWRGWAFVREVMSAYGLEAGPDLEGRIRFHAQVQSLQWLTDTIKRRADPEFHLGWLKNAFNLRSAP